MVRLKTSLQLINDPKIRATTFQRRKEGIIKKASELSTLCDVNVSMIIFDDRHQTPEIFPSNPDKFATLINLHKKFRTTDPKKIKSHEFLRNNKLEKAKRGNLRPKYPTWHEFLNGFSERSLREFASVLENKTHQVKTRIESLKKTPKFENLENPPNPIIVLDDDVVENPSPTTSMITSNNMDDCKTFGLFTGDHQNPDVVNSDSMMTEEDFNNLLGRGIDIEELFGDKSSLESIMLSEKEDDKYWYDDANFGFQIDDQFPEFEFCFSPETMQQLLQPESSSCYMEMNEFTTPSLPSHVMDYITTSDYGY